MYMLSFINQMKFRYPFRYIFLSTLSNKVRVLRDLLDWNYVISFFPVDPLQPIINLCNLYRCKKV